MCDTRFGALAPSDCKENNRQDRDEILDNSSKFRVYGCWCYNDRSTRASSSLLSSSLSLSDSRGLSEGSSAGSTIGVGNWVGDVEASEIELDEAFVGAIAAALPSLAFARSLPLSADPRRRPPARRLGGTGASAGLNFDSFGWKWGWECAAAPVGGGSIWAAWCERLAALAARTEMKVGVAFGGVVPMMPVTGEVKLEPEEEAGEEDATKTDAAYDAGVPVGVSRGEEPDDDDEADDGV